MRLTALVARVRAAAAALQQALPHGSALYRQTQALRMCLLWGRARVAAGAALVLCDRLEDEAPELAVPARRLREAASGLAAYRSPLEKSTTEGG